MYEEISIDALVANPMNANRISRMFMKKLRHNIEQLGFYETLTVRPHPQREGKYQILNGHARLEALRKLEHKSVKCDIWHISDSRARLFLAILNKLRGADVPELRMNLLFELLREHPPEDLAGHIPETARYLSKLENIESGIRQKKQPLRPDVVILSFYLSLEQRDRVTAALEKILAKFDLPDFSQALCKLAELYLENNLVPVQPHPEIPTHQNPP
jgi:ParB-like chromosome segregation protein Spo0J